MADHARRQDKFAVASQNKAEAAQKAGKFKDEIAPVTIKGKKGDTSSIRTSTSGTASLSKACKLRPAFDPKDGSVTAANASGINDGAAVVVLMTAEEAKKRGIKPLARIVPGQPPASIPRSWAPARSRLRARRWRKPAGRSTISTSIEANEAFAAQALAVNKDLAGIPKGQRERRRDRHRPSDRSLGSTHPDHAASRDERRDAHKGLATLCIGGGMGIAMCVAATEDTRSRAAEVERGCALTSRHCDLRETKKSKESII